MATLQIEFRNGMFLSHNGVNVTKASQKHIEGNGWRGDVDENGNFSFEAIQYFSGVKHKLKFRIVGGYVKKILKIGKESPQVLKSYKLDKWPIDGVIGLSNGHVDERIVYFRPAFFQDFLDKYQITAVRCESANGIFELKQTHNGHELIYSEEIETDGNYKMLSDKMGADNSSDTKTFVTTQKVEIKNASWAIKTITKFGEVKHRILYTLDNPKEIVGLPKMH